MAERDAAGCPSKSVACLRAWVLKFGCKNLYTVLQTVCKARFRSFHIVCRCVFASLDSRVSLLGQGSPNSGHNIVERIAILKFGSDSGARFDSKLQHSRVFESEQSTALGDF